MTHTLSNNPILDTDSYKLSHWVQYPAGVSGMQSYLEARGGDFAECTLFGLQYLLDSSLTQRVTRHHVEQAEAFAAAHGEPFNRAGWQHIVACHEGRLPLRIRAIPEGTVVPTGNAVMTVESTDPEVFWLVSWLETRLMRLWYPSTVAIASRRSKQILKAYLDQTADDPEAELPFKLHDFGARGVATQEQARLGGAAHLLSFLGSDTIEGIRLANAHYDCEMAGFSIPASEHSTVSMWGKAEERAMFESYVRRFLVERKVPAGLPKLAACVADTFDVFRACEAWSSDPLKSLIQSSGGTLVIRPDSGDPLDVLPRVFEILAANLAGEITVNSKGFRVLPDYLRVIQGDGIDLHSMERILQRLTELGWSASNIAFGSGGGLLQKWNRDTQRWAFKCCAAKIGAHWHPVSKDPVTDPEKRSKAGRLDLVRTPDGAYRTVVLDDRQLAHPDSALHTVFENGRILERTTLAECRARMALPT